ncbi:radical SAM protein [Rhodomicrobium udaipurense JA643]|uniref:Radical SAM protein n=1 Tax=Rhodomicrobium udaipurense TaxID=1202716 RepID=A0A8I1GFC6_9HYPH|nr:radical SAM protein [Rhodomicrobium udaipurense]KAI93635.1 radical SAM protein [Rhodomicrobium udaipurense JA643]MBJ7545025.1 radical SAM protein [Rhodomicrobium udaipurense]
MDGTSGEIFHLILIKPSHYDDDGYPIQWLRSAIPSNTLACLNGIAEDCKARAVLGEDVELSIATYDETNRRVRPDAIIRSIKPGERALVAIVGVQTNQFPRAVDLATTFRKAGLPVAIGGFHVSGCVAMLPDLPSDIRAAQQQGISLFAGEAEDGRFDIVLRDAYQGTLHPLYNFMSDLPDMTHQPHPMLPREHVRRTLGVTSSFDLGRGCPYQCSFCTIINVQGRKSRFRSPDDLEAIIRQNHAQGIHRFFITDDNFARNRNWEALFDRVIALRERERIKVKFTIQVDTLCHQIPGFVEKASKAGVSRVFIGLENINPDSLLGAKKRQNKITDYRAMLQAWKKRGVVTYAGYIIGFPNDTPETVARDIEIIKRELPVDVLEFFMLTPLPGSEDHQTLYRNGVWMDPDMNKYDINHAVTHHPRMTLAQWEETYRAAWHSFYSPEHMKTVMRRAVACGMKPGKVMIMMYWFFFSIQYEGVHPLESGYLRLKYRRDRRPSLPRESWLSFYPRYFFETVRKHVLMGYWIARMDRWRQQIMRDPNRKAYFDLALQADVPDELDNLDMFQTTRGGTEAVTKRRGEDAAREAIKARAAAE